MLTDDGEKRAMLFDVSQEKTHLRVRPRDENSSDNENDRLKSNFAEIMLKVTDITRLEVGREKSSKKSSSSPRQVKSFSIVMRKPVGESNTFNFEADSPTERDSIISSIKSVLELTKAPSDSRRRRLSRSPHLSKIGRTTPSHPESSRAGYKKEKETALSSTVKGGDIAESAAVYFDFELPNDGPEAAIEAEVRNDLGIQPSDDYRDSKSGSNDDGLSSKQAKNKKSDEYDITITENPVRRETSVEVSGAKWSVDDLLCGIAIGGGGTSSPDIISPTNSDRAIHGMYREEAQYDPSNGCHNQALTSVEDRGATDVSAGPFCTDDVCTATLKDFTDTMTGIFEMKQNSREGQPVNEKQRVMAEDYITGVLGAPTTVAANLLSVTEMWNVTPDKPDRPPAPRKKSLQNRSRNRGAQAARLARLRRQMTFAATDSGDKMPFVQIVSSCDDVERSGRFGRKLKSGEIVKAPQSDSSKFLQKVVDNMEHDPTADSGEEMLYYDSDPEDAREMTLKRGPRRAIADLDNASGRVKQRRKALSDIPMSRINMTRRLRRMDDEIVNEIIDAMKNEKMTLLWHPTQSKSEPNRSPFCSKVWIESGIYLIDGTFLLPKLTWVPVFEESLKSRLLNVTLSNPGTIDLLDVCRVRECTTIDRKVHPFASLNCSFIVQTQKETQVFEARSKQECTRIVKGLRLVIARLASLLMLRDLRAVDEFFGGHSVPGEAPSWAQGNMEASDAPTRLP